jgi:regulator of sigma E protease
MIKFGQLFLSLTILITLHEFGHFYFAKKFKTRVDKFYLFFDFLFPFGGLLNFSLFKKKIGDTEYGLGWFPFGGYVQIAGMVDEQMDKTAMEGEPQPWELRSKPAWQRLLIMMGGIIVNLVLGVVIFWMVLFVWGKETIPMSKLKNGIVCDSLALEIGFKNGDKIIAIDGEPVTTLNRVTVGIVMNKAKSVEVERDGKRVYIPLTDDDISRILKNFKKSSFVGARIQTEVDSVIDGTNAKLAGLKRGDIIIGINGQSLPFFDEFKKSLYSNKNKEIKISLLRGKDTIVVQSKVTADGTLGFRPVLPMETKSFGIFGSLKQGVLDGIESIVMQAKQFVVIFTVKDAHKQVGGFYSMYNNMNPTWVWHDFWVFTGFLSLVLAFMNFLPIPMLDGGYIMFILIEMVIGRKVSDKVIYYANYVGLMLILGLMIYANTDWLRD